MRDAPATGLFASLRQMLATTLELAQVRLALLGSDLEEQKLRVFQGLLLAGLGLALLAIGAVLLCGFILLLFWDGYRLAALGVMTLAFAAGGAWLVHTGGQRLRSTGGLFQATLAELARDRNALVQRD